MKKLFVLMLLTGLCFSQSQNSFTWGDTSIISNFKADSTKYSSIQELSRYQHLRLDVIFDDTTVAGRSSSDSCKFYWFIETGRITKDLQGRLDTVFERVNPIVIDTVNTLDTNNFKVSYRVSDSTLTFKQPLKTIDTLNFASGGGSIQSRFITSDWDTFFRVGFKGVTGNKKGSFLRLVLNVHRSYGDNVKIQ